MSQLTMSVFENTTKMPLQPTISVGIDLKELGGQLPKCLKFCPGIEVYDRFSLKNERL